MGAAYPADFITDLCSEVLQHPFFQKIIGTTQHDIFTGQFQKLNRFDPHLIHVGRGMILESAFNFLPNCLHEIRSSIVKKDSRINHQKQKSTCSKF
jgi:hypothetical protein